MTPESEIFCCEIGGAPLVEFGKIDFGLLLRNTLFPKFGLKSFALGMEPRTCKLPSRGNGCLEDCED